MVICDFGGILGGQNENPPKNFSPPPIDGENFLGSLDTLPDRIKQELLFPEFFPTNLAFGSTSLRL